MTKLPLTLALLAGCTPTPIPQQHIECRPGLCFAIVGDDLQGDARRCQVHCLLRGSELDLMYGVDFHARCKCTDDSDVFWPRSGYEVRDE